MILEKQGSRLAKRMKGMLAKKKIVSDAQLRQDLKGILINDDELSKEASKLGMAKVPNYVILGDLTLNNHEEKFLNIHFKCRERQKLQKLDLEIEISKLQTKHRYEKMSHGDDVENLPEDEMIKALKELEIEKARERFEKVYSNQMI